MSAPEFEVAAAIERASLPPGAIYHDPQVFARARERVFARAWVGIGDGGAASAPGALAPVELLPGLLDEPLLLARDGEGELRCLSNVCTHRGKLLVEALAGGARRIRCGYHGRRFDLAGRCQSAPGFQPGPEFPSASDHLPAFPVGAWGPLLFTSLAPQVEFAAWTRPLRERLGWLDLEGLRFDPAASPTFVLEANWALYCDNYLEGLHVPFVHPGLARSLDVGAYRVEVLERAVLQVGVGRPGEPALPLPPEHPDSGEPVAGYYLWLFPSTMINVYPWGISVNLVEPLGPTRTRVRYLTYVGREDLRGRGAGAALAEVEQEDQAAVESVQRGVRARAYRPGRYAPQAEAGLHHFHRLLARALAEDPA